MREQEKFNMLTSEEQELCLNLYEKMHQFAEYFWLLHVEKVLMTRLKKLKKNGWIGIDEDRGLELDYATNNIATGEFVLCEIAIDIGEEACMFLMDVMENENVGIFLFGDKKAYLRVKHMAKSMELSDRIYNEILLYQIEEFDDMIDMLREAVK